MGNPRKDSKQKRTWGIRKVGMGTTRRMANRSHPREKSMRVRAERNRGEGGSVRKRVCGAGLGDWAI